MNRESARRTRQRKQELTVALKAEVPLLCEAENCWGMCIRIGSAPEVGMLLTSAHGGAMNTAPLMLSARKLCTLLIRLPCRLQP